jgi:hypothetical protein
VLSCAVSYRFCINRSVDRKYHHSADHFPVLARHTHLKKETGGTQMLVSEKVLLMVGGPMVAVMTLAALVLTILP